MGEHGGKRAGSGRRKGAVAQVKSKITAAVILDGIGEERAWKWAIATAERKKDVKTYVDILKYLTDRRDGKPKQAIEAGGPDGGPVMFQIISEVPRPKRGSAT